MIFYQVIKLKASVLQVNNKVILVPRVPANFHISSEEFMELNMSLTFNWDTPEDMDTLFTYNITISLGPPLQSISWVVNNPPWSLNLNLNSFVELTVAITAVNSYCNVSSDPSILHYACMLNLNYLS